MGWTTGWHSKEQVIEHCLDWGSKFNSLAHTVRGNRLWVLKQYNEGERAGEVFVALYLISNSKGEWGYKDLDDSVGPYYFDCPLSYIEKTIKSGRKLSEWTVEWHEKVRAHHKASKAKRQKAKQLEVGMKIKFAGVIYKLISKYDGRRGWRVESQSDGVTYRMMSKQVRLADIV